MFGHDENNQDQPSNSNADAVASATTAPVYSDEVQRLNDAAGPTPTITSDPAVDNLAVEHTVPSLPEPNKEVLSPAGGYPQTPTQKIRPGGNDDTEEKPEEVPMPTIEAPTEPESSEDLPAIKQQVISELFPLIDELDQTPDERFKTLMMMIQATDNQTLIKAAYDAAHKISDSKMKAQALLDILNEINYFTQNNDTSS